MKSDTRNVIENSGGILIFLISDSFNGHFT